MACCLTASSHNLNQCWLISKGVLWYSHESIIWQQVLMNLICNMCMEIILFELLQHFPGANEINGHNVCIYFAGMMKNKHYNLCNCCTNVLSNPIIIKTLEVTIQKWRLSSCKHTDRKMDRQVDSTITHKHWFGNGLVPSGNKPLPEPMLTQMYVTIKFH